MCDPMTLAVAAGGASLLSGAGAIVSGVQQKKMADYQAAQSQADADAAASAARVEAAKIRKAGESQAARASAAYGASGVDTGAGSALRITSDIVGNAEEDAYLTTVNGVNSAARYNAQAQAASISGSNALTSGAIKGAGSLLEGGSKIYTAWKPYKGKP